MCFIYSLKKKYKRANRHIVFHPTAVPVHATEDAARTRRKTDVVVSHVQAPVARVLTLESRHEITHRYVEIAVEAVTKAVHNIQDDRPNCLKI